MMRKLAYLNLAVAIALLAGILILPSRRDPGLGALDSEKTFTAGLHNSLYYLAQAKLDWAEEKKKSELDIPTLEDLMPYMKDSKGRIERFMALGITYKITLTEENQSDVATLTRDLHFRRGYPIYPAGTRYCLHTGWFRPSSFRTLFIGDNLVQLLEIALLILVVGNLMVFLIKKKQQLQY